MDLPLQLDALEEALKTMAPQARAKLEELAAPMLSLPWRTQSGPQADAYFSQADELLYGGAAGGGKTDLLIGLATTSHRVSTIFRAQSKDLDDLWDRLAAVLAGKLAGNNTVKRVVKTVDDRTIYGGHLDTPGSERDHQGRARDFMGFDEAAQLDEHRISFVMQWLRSTNPGQRKRAVFATNPPVPQFKDGKLVNTAVGDWLLRWFAPWLDDTFPRPAKQGELRWCYMRSEADRLVTVWVPGPGVYTISTGVQRTDIGVEDIESGKVTDCAVAKSRTFIRSLARDNIFLKGTGYVEKLSAQPEPLRSMLLLGDFTVRGDDHPFQIIPTQWVLAAQQRWNARLWDEVKTLRQLVLYADIAQGGLHTTVLAPLYETDYFDEPITAPGSQTPTGNEVMAMLLAERLDDSLLVADGTGGWGGATRDLLKTHHGIDIEMHVASKSDESWDPDLIYKYANLRAKMWWEFRLALNPKSGYEICLPPSPRLRAQLTTPTWYPKGKIRHVEEKDEIAKRLNGASTDEADAVLGAWQYRDQAIAARTNPRDDLIEKLNGRAGKGYAGEAYELQDPRGSW